ncbi:WbuC family cupin fold metalloprotein [Carboxylicivirga linearis]|uniref:WbuC family cupin fold metalloprotein n=1 Tax=Carboxylicivirga linearis TaxID=1628157 RepID=A0ABS5JRN4_9BACT|nr:WbuC family cupin fold metalloprotein [Carboxylicivirga linearis]MBS2097224.1 WbuC family cupin fold metalloprotein [Carboxylicivirga linearis]
MIINDQLLKPVILESKNNDRRRKNYNFHKEMEDPLQRMINVLQPDSYVQPHKHENPDKREAFIILKGRLLVIIFSAEGEITESAILDHSLGNYGYDIDAGVFHSIIALEADTVVYEVKDGPYFPLDDKNFATWAPKEGDMDALSYNEKLKKLLL